MKIVGVLLLVGLMGGVGFGVWTAFQPASGVADAKKITFEVQKGTSPKQISTDLQAAGIVRNGDVLFWFGRFTRLWGQMKAAEYELSSAMTPFEVLQILTSGKGLQRPFLIREGENIYQVADTLAQLGITSRENALKLMKDPFFIKQLGFSDPIPSSLEGYLSPTTYYYGKNDPAESLIKRATQRFFSLWTPQMQKRAEELGFSQFEVVILASIVEKETGAEWERPQISSVFHNRLKKKMRLQSDPTTIYGMWENYKGSITKADLIRPSDYNTYTIPRLPIGPICNPSFEALKAVLYPDATPYLYFVSKNNGTHEFSETYEKHAEWVRKLQIDARARQGKSWRDLKKGAEAESGQR